MNNQHEREKDPLKKPEQFHRFMFEDNPQPMWVYDLETLKFLKVNKAAVAVYGYTEKEFMTMTLKDIRPAEDVPKLLRNIESTINTYNQAGVWQHNKKNGDTLIVEIHSHLDISVILTPISVILTPLSGFNSKNRWKLTFLQFSS